jgi:hypothetical protein
MDSEIREADKAYREKLLDNIFEDKYEETYEETLQKIIEMSIYEQCDKEKEKINRRKSLERFSKRIQYLSLFDNKDTETVKKIETILDDYFDLEIDFIHVKDDMYIKIFEIIDSFYLIPTEKKYKKTGITSDEDKILRSIFRY